MEHHECLQGEIIQRCAPSSHAWKINCDESMKTRKRYWTFCKTIREAAWAWWENLTGGVSSVWTRYKLFLLPMTEHIPNLCSLQHSPGSGQTQSIICLAYLTSISLHNGYASCLLQINIYMCVSFRKCSAEIEQQRARRSKDRNKKTAELWGAQKHSVFYLLSHEQSHETNQKLLKTHQWATLWFIYNVLLPRVLTRAPNVY